MPTLVVRLIIVLIYCFICLPVVYLGLGFLLVRFRITHKLGCMLWAMSGLFPKRLPRYCRQTCDRSCGNWTCPKFQQR